MKVPGARIAILVALGCGCGLTVVGSLEPDLIVPATDGGPETGAALPEGGGTDAAVDAADDSSVDIGPIDIVDASIDVNPGNCQAKCDGGTCDGGWCTFTCGASQCQNAPVVCPPGVPCAVACNADGSCNKGVDCSAATACDIGCKGSSTCINGTVSCSGAACAVRCSGPGTCNQGVVCDAGSCGISCKGHNSCQNSTIGCRADTCLVVCGDGAGNGTNACNKGVSCTATKSCDIVCQDQNTCQNQRIVAVSGGSADVRCTAGGACNSGILVSAADGGALCKDTSCGQGIFCDGGACNARCNGTDVDVCCKAGSCSKQSNNCTLTNSCP